MCKVETWKLQKMAQIKLLSMETMMSKVRNARRRVNSRTDSAEEQIRAPDWTRDSRNFPKWNTQRTKTQNQINRVSMSCGTISNGLRYKWSESSQERGDRISNISRTNGQKCFKLNVLNDKPSDPWSSTKTLCWLVKTRKKCIYSMIPIPEYAN